MASIHSVILFLLTLASKNSLTASATACSAITGPWAAHMRMHPKAIPICMHANSAHTSASTVLGREGGWVDCVIESRIHQELEQECAIQLTGKKKKWGRILSPNSSFLRKRWYLSQLRKLAVKKAFWETVQVLESHWLGSTPIAIPYCVASHKSLILTETQFLTL